MTVQSAEWLGALVAAAPATDHPVRAYLGTYYLSDCTPDLSVLIEARWSKRKENYFFSWFRTYVSKCVCCVRLWSDQDDKADQEDFTPDSANHILGRIGRLSS